MLIEPEKVYGGLRSVWILLLPHEINKQRGVASVLQDGCVINVMEYSSVHQREPPGRHPLALLYVINSKGDIIAFL